MCCPFLKLKNVPVYGTQDVYILSFSSLFIVKSDIELYIFKVNHILVHISLYRLHPDKKCEMTK